MEKKKNIVFLITQIVVAAAGLFYMLACEKFKETLIYLALMAFTIPDMYFNYSLCKWWNRWHSTWHERTPCDGEPSNYSLVINKVSSWILFIGALLLPFIELGSI